MRKATISQARIHVGTDIERVERFRNELRSSSRFFSRIFTNLEVKYCMAKVDPPLHFAGTYAAKEAAKKAVCALTRNSIPTLNFEVTHRRDGVPEVRYTGKNPETRRVEIRVSISHTTDDAVAVALAILPGRTTP